MFHYLYGDREGGSGAFGIGVGERLLMFEHATVATPEACAAIL